MSIIGGINLTGATIAAFGALLVYDVFFVTFDQEVNLVWPSRWGIAKVLFLINRYLPFVDTFLSLHLLLGTNTSQECLLGFRAVTWLTVIGILIAQMILMLRTYALWGSRRWVLILLCVLACSVYIPAVVVTEIEVMSFSYEALPRGCVKTKDTSPIIFVAFLLLIVNETAIVILTLLSARIYSKQHRSPIVHKMFKDGIYCYIFLLAFSLVNLLIAVAAPPQFANWFTTPQRVFHSLLCTRILLRIRAFAATNGSDMTTKTLESIEFNPNNINVTLADGTIVSTVADADTRRHELAKAAKGTGKARRDGLSFVSTGFASEFATATYSPDPEEENAWDTSDATIISGDEGDAHNGSGLSSGSTSVPVLEPASGSGSKYGPPRDVL